MTLTDTLWLAPLEAGEGPLKSIYQTDAPEIGDGQAFTVSLEAVKLGRTPDQGWLDRITRPTHDVLIVSSSALGAKPPIERVHYYQADVARDQALLVHDLLSDTICVCDDYQSHDALYLELQVVTIETAAEYRESTLKAFETLLSTAGSVYPVALPFAALADGMLAAVNKLWDTLDKRETWRILEPIRLFPPKTRHVKTLRPGRYVVFSKAVDGTQIQIADNCQLDGKVEGDLSYAVFRVDPDNEPSIDYVISQRVATLLTQLTNDQKNRPAGMLETSLGYLTDTLKAYTNFTDLERYQDLLAKGTSRTSAESDQMTKLESRSDLQPFLKPLKASQTT